MTDYASDTTQITPAPDGDGVILYLPDITYLDTQVWSVEIGLTPSRLAELRAVLNAAARQTTGQTDTEPLATPCGYCSHTLNWHTPGGRCQLNSGPNGCGCSTFVAPDGSHPDTEAAPWIADGRHGPTPAEMADARIPTCYVQFMGGAHCATAPVVGQPAEAQATDRAAVLAEAIEAAEGELLQDDTGSSDDEAYNRGVHDAVVALRRMAEEARS